MAALMQKTACAPAVSAARPALPCRAAVRRANVVVRAQAQQTAASQVGKALALSSAAATMMFAGNASAAVELSQLAAGDNRIASIATLFVPALGWVAYNMFQPALSQLDRMNELALDGNQTSVAKNVNKVKKAISKRGVAAAVGLGAAASMLLAESANAATELGQLAASDNRIASIATLFVPALGWVGYNILQPAANQLERMNELAESGDNKTAVAKNVKKVKKAISKRGVAAVVGLGAAASMLLAENASAATELGQLAASDNRIASIATLFVPALGWVGYNILQPAFNQLERMNELAESGDNKTAVAKNVKKVKKAISKRSVAAAVGISAAASMLLAESASAATELSQIAATDNRILSIGLLFLPALGWVGYNILQPAANQLERMNELAESGDNKTAVAKNVKKARAAVKKAVKK